MAPAESNKRYSRKLSSRLSLKMPKQQEEGAGRHEGNNRQQYLDRRAALSATSTSPGMFVVGFPTLRGTGK